VEEFIGECGMRGSFSPGSSNHIIFRILISLYLYKPTNGMKQKKVNQIEMDERINKYLSYMKMNKIETRRNVYSDLRFGGYIKIIIWGSYDGN